MRFYYRHYRQKTYHCQICNTTYTEPSRLTRCRQRHAGRFRCPTEGCLFSYVCSLCNSGVYQLIRSQRHCRHPREGEVRKHLVETHQDPNPKGATIALDASFGRSDPPVPRSKSRKPLPPVDLVRYAAAHLEAKQKRKNVQVCLQQGHASLRSEAAVQRTIRRRVSIRTAPNMAITYLACRRILSVLVQNASHSLGPTTPRAPSLPPIQQQTIHSFPSVMQVPIPSSVPNPPPLPLADTASFGFSNALPTTIDPRLLVRSTITQGSDTFLPGTTSTSAPTAPYSASSSYQATPQYYHIRAGTVAPVPQPQRDDTATAVWPFGWHWSYT